MGVSVQVAQLLRTCSTVVDLCELAQIQKLAQLLQSGSTARNWINCDIADCYSNMKIGESGGDQDLSKSFPLLKNFGLVLLKPGSVSWRVRNAISETQWNVFLRVLCFCTLARWLAHALTLYPCSLPRWLFRTKCLLKTRLYT